MDDAADSESSVDDTTPADVQDWHTGLLRHRFGRVAVGVVVAVVSFSIVAPNMATSAVRDRLDMLWEPAVSAGLVQDWAVFSPNPRSQSIDVRARLEYGDGTIDFWDVPEFDPGIGAFREYRWNKWQERIRLDDRNEYWLSTAEWIAGRSERDGAGPVRVTLIRRWIDHEPLTADGPAVDLGWNEFEFFVWERPA